MRHGPPPDELLLHGREERRVHPGEERLRLPRGPDVGGGLVQLGQLLAEGLEAGGGHLLGGTPLGDVAGGEAVNHVEDLLPARKMRC